MKNIMVTVAIVALLFVTGCVGGTQVNTLEHKENNYPNFSEEN